MSFLSKFLGLVCLSQCLHQAAARYVVQCDGNLPQRGIQGSTWPQALAPELQGRWWWPEQFLDLTDLCATDLSFSETTFGPGPFKPSAGYYCIQAGEEGPDGEGPGSMIVDIPPGVSELFDAFSDDCSEKCRCVDVPDDQVADRQRQLTQFARPPHHFGPTDQRAPVCPRFACRSFEDCAASRSKPGCGGVACVAAAFATALNPGTARCRTPVEKREVGACPCNSTYISEACCGEPSGMVWEAPELKRGQLDVL
ncbi:MAG: hypothetical protein M1817_000193 [Caeruleum heppii]|nr:MAG: hypothetical protein M1817_000193 [Caeruleum heppii]